MESSRPVEASFDFCCSRKKEPFLTDLTFLFLERSRGNMSDPPPPPGPPPRRDPSSMNPPTKATKPPSSPPLAPKAPPPTPAREESSKVREGHSSWDVDDDDGSEEMRKFPNVAKEANLVLSSVVSRRETPAHYY